MNEKEKFEEAKRLYQTANADQRYVIETLFPELKESEDERIRESLLEYLHTLPNHYSHDGVCAPEWIAWLEEQCELVNSLSKGLDNAHEHIDELIQKNNELCIKLEKQGEQESTNKHEPKFKVYDWCIDNEDDIIFQIVKVLDNTYTYRTNEGKEYSCTHYSLENEARLWTIQDAKDGDVLCVKYGNDEMPFIFTGKQDNVAYCALNSFGEFVLSIAEWLLKISVLPATKEQHDILFAKMKEAGFEWDSEKKELKKISQCMISAEAKEAMYDKPTWSEEDENTIKVLMNIIRKSEIIDSIIYTDSLKEKLYDWLKSIKERYAWKPSDAQIEALGVATDICSIPEKQYNELNKLYHELKKLKGDEV